MADNRRYAQTQQFRLAGGGVLSGATEIIVRDFLGIEGEQLTMAYFGELGNGTLEPNTPREEAFVFTGIIQNGDGTATLTGVKNSAFLYNANGDEYPSTPGLNKAHAGGATLITSTDNPILWDSFVNKYNEELIENVHTYKNPEGLQVVSDPNLAPTQPDQYIWKAYADQMYGGGVVVPTVVNTSSTTSNGNQVTDIQWEHTSSSTNRLLLVQISMEAGKAVTGITYDGNALTNVSVQESGDARIEMWSLLAPPVGTYIIDVTFDAASYMSGGAETLSGVDQTNPTGTVASAAGNDTNPSVINTNTQDNSMIVDGLSTALPGVKHTTGPGQTLNWRHDDQTDTRQGSSSVEPSGQTPDAIPMTYDMDFATDWAITSVEVWGIESGTGATGPSTGVETTVTQTAHGFSGGDVIRSAGVDNQYTAALADNEVNAETVGIVTQVIDVDTFVYAKDIVAYSGAGIPAGTPGEGVWLSDTTPGAMTITQPTTVGYVQKPLGIITASGTLMNFTADYRGQVVGDGTGNGGGNGNSIQLGDFTVTTSPTIYVGNNVVVGSNNLNTVAPINDSLYISDGVRLYPDAITGEFIRLQLPTPGIGSIFRGSAMQSDGNFVYFMAADGGGNKEIIRYDNTNVAVAMNITTAPPIGGGANPDTYREANMYVYNNKMYLAVSTGTFTSEYHSFDINGANLDWDGGSYPNNASDRLGKAFVVGDDVHFIKYANDTTGFQSIITPADNPGTSASGGNFASENYPGPVGGGSSTHENVAQGVGLLDLGNGAKAWVIATENASGLGNPGAYLEFHSYTTINV